MISLRSPSIKYRTHPVHRARDPMQDQQKMFDSQKEMFRNYKKDNFESTMSAVSVIVKEVMKTVAAEQIEATEMSSPDDPS